MDKTMFSTRIETQLRKALKILSAETEKPVADLTEEALKDLLKKYGKKPPKTD